MPRPTRFEQLPVEIQAELRTLHGRCARGREAEAIEGLARIVASYPGYVAASFLLGRALRMTGQRERAAKIFKAAAAFAPDDPGICLGLAWGKLDARDFLGAVALAQVARERPAYRGDALAIEARAAEAAGDETAAARLFLAAYESKPIIPWLEAHCRHAGRPFVHPSERPTRAWPLSPSQRLWLYATLEAELGAIAKAKDRDIEVADLLAAGCDHTPRLTAAWARRAGIEPAELYQALAARGGFCDCEVLLNAARDDDRELDAVLVAGTIEAGIVADCVDQLLLEGEPPSLPWLGASPSEDKKSHGALLVGADGERVSPQLVDSLTIGEMLRLLSSVELDHAVARVLLVYPDADGATEIVDVGGEHTRFRTLPPDADPADEPELSSTARADLEALRRAIPARDPVTASGTIDWPPAAAGPLLLARAGGSWLTVEVGAGASPRGIGLETDALATTPTMDRIAWLSTYRARTDLLVEDRGCPVRTRLATARFGRSLGFSADGAFLFAVDAGEVVRYELATGARQTLCPGTEVRTAPRGAMLAITADDELSIWSTDGRLVLPPRAGHSPVWSPQGDKLGYLGRVDGEGWQIFVLDVRRDRAWRVSPPCREACWPSFTDGGAALVLWGSTARHETPVGGGRIRVEDDEVLWHVPADGSAEVRVIWSAARGYQRILAPVAHPQLPLVAFRTQDAPQVGRRLVLARTTGEEQPRTFLEQDARAVAWLDR